MHAIHSLRGSCLAAVSNAFRWAGMARETLQCCTPASLFFSSRRPNAVSEGTSAAVKVILGWASTALRLLMTTRPVLAPLMTILGRKLSSLPANPLQHHTSPLIARRDPLLRISSLPCSAPRALFVSGPRALRVLFVSAVAARVRRGTGRVPLL